VVFLDLNKRMAPLEYSKFKNEVFRGEWISCHPQDVIDTINYLEDQLRSVWAKSVDEKK
jgi:hypothetical protein